MDTNPSDKIKEEDFKSIKEKFQSNMRLLASMSNTEISKYDEVLEITDEVHRIEFA